MKTLVTGGLGFIGAALTRALVERGEDVRVLDNSSRGSAEKLGDRAKDVEIVEGDIRDPRAVDAAVKGSGSVLHLAFVNGTEFFYKYPDYVLDVGVKGMVNVLDSSIRHGVKEFVLASSSEVYQTPPAVPTDESAPISIPDPLNPRYSYGGGKAICELMAINYGRERFERMMIFRPHNVYGPAMGWEHVIPQFALRMKELMEKDPTRPLPFPIQGDGSQTRAFIYIDDFTDGLMTMLDKGRHMNIYHIGSMSEVTIREVAEAVAETLGVEIALVPGEAPRGGTPRRCPDTRKLRALGFDPKISLEEGVRKTVQWYATHPRPERKAGATPELYLG